MYAYSVYDIMGFRFGFDQRHKAPVRCSHSPSGSVVRSSSTKWIHRHATSQYHAAPSFDQRPDLLHLNGYIII